MRGEDRLRAQASRLWARLWRYTVVKPGSRCFIWCGPVRRHAAGPRGYLTVRLDPAPSNPKHVTVYRLAFFLTNGFFPVEGGHTCANPLCWNPDHVRSVTRYDNYYERDRRLGHTPHYQYSKAPEDAIPF